MSWIKYTDGFGTAWAVEETNVIIDSLAGSTGTPWAATTIYADLEAAIAADDGFDEALPPGVSPRKVRLDSELGSVLVISPVAVTSGHINAIEGSALETAAIELLPISVGYLQGESQVDPPATND